MNGYQRIMAAFKGERPDSIPIMLHNFMMAAREAGVTMKKYRENPAEIARCFIEAVEKYAYDGIVIDVDTVTLAGAVGVPIDFPADEPARVRGNMLKDLREVNNLELLDIQRYPAVQVWLEAVSRLKRHFGDEILIRGNCDQCPFTLASMLRGMGDWMADLLDPEQEGQTHRLLDYCTGVTLQFVRLMTAAGAHMISNGDSVATPDLVAPTIHRKFALPYEKRIVECSHALGLPYILHICGNTASILDGMIESGADGLELDYKTDTSLAHAKMKDRTVFIGNIDPSSVLALGTPDLVERKTRELLLEFSDTPRFILNAGCAIPPVTPPENLKAMIRTAREM
jgi:uroporphyrinogen decarboxylase